MDNDFSLGTRLSYVYDHSMDEDFPKGIGPHDGRELELMLAGKKPLAMFNDDWPEELEPPEVSFDPFVAEGKFIKSIVYLPVSVFNNELLRYYFYALPQEVWRIAKIIEIQQRLFVNKLATTPELEQETGRLLGYEDADINVFLERIFGRK